MKGLIAGKSGIEACLSVDDRTRLQRLVLLSRNVVEGNLSGAHRSPLRGVSSEFSDHKQYGQGDDPKYMDWRVVARTDKYYVKRFEDETNLRVYLVLDRSGSMGYGSGSITKYAYALQLAAAIGYVVVKARDAIGLFLHAEGMDAQMPARNSMQHLNDIIRQGMQFPPQRGREGNLAEALHIVASSVRRRALVVVLSDLLGDEGETRKAMAHLRKKHHDVIALQILDPAELDLTVGQGNLFVDLETGERLPASPEEIRSAYVASFGKFLDDYQRHCAAMGIDYRIARTDERLARFMRGWLLQRRKFTV